MRFTYAGTFFDLMSPEYIFEALAIVFNKRPELRNEIEACFLGVFSKENLKLIKKNNISDVIFNPGYVNHLEAIKYMQQSDVLWFTIGKGEGSEMLSPVKLGEYIGARKPILACVPDGAAKLLLKGYDAVKFAEPDEPAQIANMIIEYYDQFKTRTIPAANEEFVQRFDVEKLTHQLVRYFEFLIDINPDFEFRGKKALKHSIETQNWR
jgi:glycosyltransferase involved in cell wall biosynthesis